MEKFYIEADIRLEETTDELFEAAAAVIELPRSEDKQPDLQYFSAVFVSAGANLNHAYFLPSELVRAKDTIVSKALDIEHSEDEIIGHIYDRAFVDGNHKRLDLTELSNKEEGSINTENSDMHVVIAGVVYKNRFPGVAKEIADGSWKVSMECYFSDYDVKVGDLVLSRKEAEAMGLASTDRFFGKLAKVMRDGKEIADGVIERVLRNITFSGCGIVKNPANPSSVILETASEKEHNTECKEVVILNYSVIDHDNKLTSNKIDENDSVITDPSDTQPDLNSVEEENSAAQPNDVGICVNYKRRLDTGEENSNKEDWCTAYDKKCTSFSRDTTDPDCMRHEIKAAAAVIIRDMLNRANKFDNRKELTKKLNNLLDVAKKLN
jgi:hypothetical protein